MNVEMYIYKFLNELIWTSHKDGLYLHRNFRVWKGKIKRKKKLNFLELFKTFLPLHTDFF
jgi:hypothetical protein